MPSNVGQSPELKSSSPSTAVTTPEDVPNDDDNIWESDGDNEQTLRDRPHGENLLSDLPTIKRQHMTDGYREGLAVGKAKVMQHGFDRGYPIGIQLALRVGLVLGVLEGYLASKSVSKCTDQRTNLQSIYEKAKAELSCAALLKDISDEVVAEATTIPASIESVVSRWEHDVLGQSHK